MYDASVMDPWHKAIVDVWQGTPNADAVEVFITDDSVGFEYEENVVELHPEGYQDKNPVVVCNQMLKDFMRTMGLP